MKKKHTIAGLSVILVVLLAGVAGLIFNAFRLSDQVAQLEQKISANKDTLAQYERSLCKGRAEKVFATDVVDYSVRSAELDRTYSVDTPDNYDPTVRYPLILSFDGIEGSGDRMRVYAHLDELPAVVVYLDALPGKKKFSAWQGAPYSADGDRDLEFVDDVLDAVPNNYCIDQTQQFAVGMSNGGAFATLVGCVFGDEIRAVASVSGAYYKKCQAQEKTPSLLIVHSESDVQVPFNGSAARNLPNIADYADEQAAKRQCKDERTSKDTQGVIYYDWGACRDNSMLRLAVLKDQRHGWLNFPKTTQKDRLPTYSTAEYIWEFFKAL